MNFHYDPSQRKFEAFGRSLTLPEGKWTRIGIGGLFVVSGFLGFLPVLGFWMIPVGLVILSQDLPMVRRWRRALVLKWGRAQERQNAAKKKQDGGAAAD